MMTLTGNDSEKLRALIEQHDAEESEIAIDTECAICHLAAKSRGWWTDIHTGESLIGKRNVPEMLCLMHSEISEALEGYRKNLPSEKLPGFTAMEEELADLLIRTFDLAGALRLRLGAAYVAKYNYNTLRQDHSLEARKQENGKKF